MKDEERLQLLKEVAGTRVYEDRREEALKIMQETNSKRDKIQEVIAPGRSGSASAEAPPRGTHLRHGSAGASLELDSDW